MSCAPRRRISTSSAVAGVARSDDAPGDDLEPALGDHPRDRVARPRGAIRWRWTSHHGRAWRRKRRCCSAIEALPQRVAVRPAGCRPRRASRPRRCAAAASARVARRLPLGTSSGSTGAGSKSACARGIRPRRDSATIWPAGGPPRRATAPGRPWSGRCRSAAPSPPLAASSLTAAWASAPHGLLMKRSPAPANARSASGSWLPIASTSASASSRLAVVELDLPAAVLARRAASRSPSTSCDVAAAQLPRRGFRRDSGRTVGARANPRRSPPSASNTLGEMVRLAGPGAHAFGADVEQVRRLGRRIGDAAADPPAAVDQDRADAAPRELRREDRPRKSAADDRDRHDPVRFHSRASSPGWPRPPCAWHMVVDAGRRSCPRSAVNQPGTAAWTMHAQPAPISSAPILTAPAPCPAQLIPSERGCSMNSRCAGARLGLGCSAARRPWPLALRIVVTPTGFEPVALRLGI